MKILAALYFAGIIAWLPLSAGIPSDNEIYRQEEVLARKDSLISAMNRQIDALKKQAAAITNRINALRASESLNFIERQQLESHLKESQTISRTITQMQTTIKQTRQNADSSRVRLDQLYDRRLETLITALKNKTPAAQRDSILSEIVSLKQRKLGIQGSFSDEPSYAQRPGIRLTIDEMDTPETLKRKADFLKDQEDRYRRYLALLGKKIADLEKELALREKLSDFVADLSLFDQRDDALQKTASAAQTGNESFSTLYGGTKNRDYENITVNQLNDPLLFNIDAQMTTPMPVLPNDLDQIIRKLKKEKIKVQDSADSLSTQAEIYYHSIKNR